MLQQVHLLLGQMYLCCVPDSLIFIPPFYGCESYHNSMQFTETYLLVTTYLQQVRLQLKHRLLLDVVDVRRLAIQHSVTIPYPGKCWHLWKYSSMWILMYSENKSGCHSTWVVEGGGGWVLQWVCGGCLAGKGKAGLFAANVLPARDNAVNKGRMMP